RGRCGLSSGEAVGGQRDDEHPQATGVRPQRSIDANALLSSLGEALQRVEARGFLVPAGNPDIRRGRKGELHDRVDQDRRLAFAGNQHLPQGLVREQEPMTRRAVALAAGATILLVAPTGWSQQRPREDELFGAPDAGSNQPPTRPSESEMFGGSAPDGGTASPAPDHGPAAESATEDERGLASGASKDLFATEPTRDNPLQIGGKFALRSLVQATENISVADTRFLFPAIGDGFFAARPRGRVRGFILGRLTYDPTLAPNATGNAFGVATSSNPAVL